MLFENWGRRVGRVTTLLLLHLLEITGNVLVLRLYFVGDPGAISLHRAAKAMNIGSSSQVTMIAQELTESVRSSIIGAIDLLIIFGLIRSLIQCCRACIFVDQELTFEVGHLGK